VKQGLGRSERGDQRGASVAERDRNRKIPKRKKKEVERTTA